jgi:hypothetical protein
MEVMGASAQTKNAFVRTPIFLFIYFSLFSVHANAKKIFYFFCAYARTRDFILFFCTTAWTKVASVRARWNPHEQNLHLCGRRGIYLFIYFLYPHEQKLRRSGRGEKKIIYFL